MSLQTISLCSLCITPLLIPTTSLHTPVLWQQGPQHCTHARQHSTPSGDHCCFSLRVDASQVQASQTVPLAGVLSFWYRVPIAGGAGSAQLHTQPQGHQHDTTISACIT